MPKNASEMLPLQSQTQNNVKNEFTLGCVIVAPLKIFGFLHKVRGGGGNYYAPTITRKVAKKQFFLIRFFVNIFVLVCHTVTNLFTDAKIQVRWTFQIKLEIAISFQSFLLFSKVFYPPNCPVLQTYKKLNFCLESQNLK